VSAPGSEGLRAAMGRRVVSAESAEEIGQLVAVVVDQPPRHITSLQVAGSKRKPTLVEWDGLSGFGPDAVMVRSENDLRAATDDAEVGATRGDLSLLGARVLDDAGEEHGTVDDVRFDPATGALLAVSAVGPGRPPAAFAPGDLLALGSYALMVRAPAD
jgi:sporulation protein YlmC with PRC-barrel domain